MFYLRLSSLLTTAGQHSIYELPSNLILIHCDNSNRRICKWEQLNVEFSCNKTQYTVGDNREQEKTERRFRLSFPPSVFLLLSFSHWQRTWKTSFAVNVGRQTAEKMTNTGICLHICGLISSTLVVLLRSWQKKKHQWIQALSLLNSPPLSLLLTLLHIMIYCPHLPYGLLSHHPMLISLYSDRCMLSRLELGQC